MFANEKRRFLHNPSLVTLFNRSKLKREIFLGKRACVGDTLSYWILYLFGGNIIRNFHVSMEDNLSEEELSTIMDGEFGITLSPATHNIIFKCRV